MSTDRTLHMSSDAERENFKSRQQASLSAAPHSDSAAVYGSPGAGSNRPELAGRPTGRVVSTTRPTRENRPNSTVTVGLEPVQEGLSAPGRRPYATHARAAAVRTQLSERDLAIIQTLGAVQVATSRQLEILHFKDLKPSGRPRQRSAVLARLTKLGVLARLPRRIGGMRAGSTGYIFALDLLGQRLLGRAKVRTPPTPTWPYPSHALALTDLYVAASEAEADGRLDFLRFTPEPRCWSLIEGEVSLRPDAVVSVKPAVASWTDHWAVEVDMASERPVRLRKKLLTYWEAFQTGGALRGTSVFPKVLLTVPDEHRLDQCLRVIEGLPTDARHLVEVMLHDQAVALLASGGPA